MPFPDSASGHRCLQASISSLGHGGHCLHLPSGGVTAFIHHQVGPIPLQLHSGGTSLHIVYLWVGPLPSLTLMWDNVRWGHCLHLPSSMAIMPSLTLRWVHALTYAKGKSVLYLPLDRVTPSDTFRWVMPSLTLRWVTLSLTLRLGHVKNQININCILFKFTTSFEHF